MKSKLIYILIFLIIPLYNLLGQQIVSSAGAQAKGTTVELSWTIGEPVIETISDGSTVLTQGFHQSNLKVTAINEISIPGIQLVVYPNPVSEKLNIELRKGEIENLACELCNSEGKLMSITAFNILPGQINMESYSSGSYLLKISNKEGQPIQIFKIIKK